MSASYVLCYRITGDAQERDGRQEREFLILRYVNNCSKPQVARPPDASSLIINSASLRVERQVRRMCHVSSYKFGEMRLPKAPSREID